MSLTRGDIAAVLPHCGPMTRGQTSSRAAWRRKIDLRLHRLPVAHHLLAPAPERADLTKSRRLDRLSSSSPSPTVTRRSALAKATCGATLRQGTRQDHGAPAGRLSFPRRDRRSSRVHERMVDLTLRLLLCPECRCLRSICERCDSGRLTCSDACSHARRARRVLGLAASVILSRGLGRLGGGC